MSHSTDIIRVGAAPLYGATRPGLAGANMYQGGEQLISKATWPLWGRGFAVWPQTVYSIVPLTLGNALIAGSQTPSGAGALTLTAGTGVTAKTFQGSTYLFLDCARTVTFTTLGSESSTNVTVTGLDMYYQPQTQTQALPASATTGSTTKTFIAVLSVTVSAATSLAITVGTGDTFGLPYVFTDRVQVLAKWNNTLALDAGTATVADTTSPATASTGDVRGTYKPSSGASDGTKRLAVWLFTLDPDTDAGLFGVVPV